MRLWLALKKEKIVYEIYKMYIIGTGISYFLLRDDFILCMVVLTVLLLVSLSFVKNSFVKREFGLTLEDKSANWLDLELSKRGISIKKSISMKYGDIDIFIPEKRIVIDVKAFCKIDKRLQEPDILRSMSNQMKYTGAEYGLFWLPNSKAGDVEKISDSIYVVRGKRSLVKFLTGEHDERNEKLKMLVERDKDGLARRSDEVVLCPACGSPMKLRINKNTSESFYGCTCYPTCKVTKKA